MYIIILLFILLFFIFTRRTQDCNKFKKHIANKLLRQSARWAVASLQDNSALISVLHANYGAGYLWALKDILNDNEIEEFTGVDLEKFENEITKSQDSASKKSIIECPKFGPEPSYLTRISGE